MNEHEKDQILTKETMKSLLKKQKLVRENVKSLSNSVTTFCDQEIYEGFYFFRH